jgi:hypothetical protein
MPADHSFRAHDDESLLPTEPKPARQNPEDFIERSQSRSAFVSGRGVVVEERDFPTDECGEPANTGKSLSPTDKVCETLGCVAKTVWISMSYSIDSKSRWSFGEGQRQTRQRYPSFFTRDIF